VNPQHSRFSLEEIEETQSHIANLFATDAVSLHTKATVVRRNHAETNSASRRSSPCLPPGWVRTTETIASGAQ
jgi:hypothetical protein